MVERDGIHRPGVREQDANERYCTAWIPAENVRFMTA